MSQPAEDIDTRGRFRSDSNEKKKKKKEKVDRMHLWTRERVIKSISICYVACALSFNRTAQAA